MGNENPFGGKVIVIGGDFRQTLPVVPRGKQAKIVEESIKRSPLWRHFSTLTLINNMRTDGHDDHNNWLLKVGTGDIEPIQGLPYRDNIEIPTAMIGDGDMIRAVFGENIDQVPEEELRKRVILSPTNKQSLEINRTIITQLSGTPSIYYSADSMVTQDPSDALNFPTEFLNNQMPSGMPPHVLVLKKGVVIMLLRNLNPNKGLCNGTRLIVRDLHRNFITAEIISECNRGDVVFVPRIDLMPTDTTLPFVLRRRQFPIIPAYAITINKSQGQSYECVGINLKTPVFSHGQLYVALSRSRNPNNIKVFVYEGPQQGKLLKNNRQFTRNVVFKEIFQT
jgi:ATP-dependent DNA helicase PIF1